MNTILIVSGIVFAYFALQLGIMYSYSSFEEFYDKVLYRKGFTRKDLHRLVCIHWTIVIASGITTAVFVALKFTQP